MDYTIENRHGHVEVRDSAGRFVFSADTISEAMHELEGFQERQLLEAFRNES